VRSWPATVRMGHIHGRGVIIGTVDLGGHAGFVWAAYAVAVTVLIGLLCLSLRERSVRRRQLSELEAATGGRRRRRSGGTRS